MKKYFLTGVDLHCFAPVQVEIDQMLNSEAFLAMKADFDGEFASMEDLKNALTESKGAGAEVILTRFTDLFENGIRVKYPQAKISFDDSI
jgi:hypothetical protein